MASQPDEVQLSEEKPRAIRIASPSKEKKRVMISFESPPNIPSDLAEDSDSRAVRFKVSPTTVVDTIEDAQDEEDFGESPRSTSTAGGGNGTATEEEDEAERISKIRRRSRRRSGRPKRSPTPFVRRSCSSVNSEDNDDASSCASNLESATLSDVPSEQNDSSSSLIDDAFAIASANASANANTKSDNDDSCSAPVSHISLKRAEAKERAKRRRSVTIGGGGGVRFGGQPADASSTSPTNHEPNRHRDDAHHSDDSK